MKKIILPIVFFIFLSSFVFATDYYVTENCSPTPDGTLNNPYCLVQDAVTVANGGDTINVAAGTYTENVNVNKPLTLKGASSATVTVTAANSAVSVFTVNANNVDISGFTITGANVATTAGIYLSNDVANCNIHDNILIGNGDGIWLGSGSNHNTLTDNTLSSNYQGFEVYHSDYNTFTNNIADSNNVYGFKMESSSHNTLTDNTANLNAKYGFYCSAGSTGCNDNTFTDNTANSNTEYGMRINSGSGNTLTGNTFNLNGVAGIRLKDAITNLIFNGNSFTNSPIGIDIATVATNVATWTVSNNKITGNTNYGVSNLGTGTLNAENNYWGSAEPNFGTAVTGNVDYDQWWMDSEMTLPSTFITIFNNVKTTLATTGIDTNINTCGTTPNSCTGLYFDKIGKGKDYKPTAKYE